MFLLLCCYIFIIFTFLIPLCSVSTPDFLVTVFAAFTVRLLTKRFIGEYDSTLGKRQVMNKHAHYSLLPLSSGSSVSGKFEKNVIFF